MLEYTTDAAVKSAMVRAHAERGQVLQHGLKQACSWLFRKRTAPILHPKVSRWA